MEGEPVATSGILTQYRRYTKNQVASTGYDAIQTIRAGLIQTRPVPHTATGDRITSAPGHENRTGAPQCPQRRRADKPELSFSARDIACCLQTGHLSPSTSVLRKIAIVKTTPHLSCEWRVNYW